MTTAAEPAARTSNEQVEPDPVVTEAARPRSNLVVALVHAATAALFLLVVVAAFFHDVRRSPDFDPQYMRVLVERSMRFGSNFYVSGIHNKGPLEPIVYRVAAAVGGHDGFWYAIAALVMLAALACAAAAAAVAKALGAPRALAVAAGAALFVHLTLSGADYAGVLYARNMTVALLASALVVVVTERMWATPRRAGVAAALVGVLLGLVAQTLLTEGLACAALLAIAVWWRRDVRWGSIRAVWAIVVAAAVTFASAPFAYTVTGSSREFFDGWWRYAGFMSAGTGRSVADQIGLGWDQGYVYYQDRPLALVVVVAAIVLAVVTWRRSSVRARALQLGLIGWWAAAWIELTASQRYSSHYFSVLALPTALLATVAGVSLLDLAGDLRRSTTWRWTSAAPGLAVVIALYLGNTASLRDGLRAEREFHGIHAAEVQREQGQGGTVRTVRAVLDLVSADGDPLLAWTSYPWTYLDVDRVAATRFIWKTFLIGEIYLGRTSQDYVLPDTWSDFDADLRQSDPAAFVSLSATPVQADTPFAAYVEREFREAYVGPVEQVHLRRAIFDQLVGGRSTTPWVATGSAGSRPGAGWQVGTGTVAFTGAPATSATAETGAPAPLTLDDRARCARFDATVDAPGGTLPDLSFVVDDPTGGSERVRLGIRDGEAYSASDTVRFEAVPVHASGASSSVSLVVGDRSAALIVDGQIVAAVRLAGPSRISLSPSPGLSVTGLTSGPSTLGDCAGGG